MVCRCNGVRSWGSTFDASKREEGRGGRGGRGRRGRENTNTCMYVRRFLFRFYANFSPYVASLNERRQAPRGVPCGRSARGLRKTETATLGSGRIGSGGCGKGVTATQHPQQQHTPSKTTFIGTSRVLTKKTKNLLYVSCEFSRCVKNHLLFNRVKKGSSHLERVPLFWAPLKLEPRIRS